MVAMKVVRDSLGLFCVGWTRCACCDKRIKYRLEVGVALMMLENYELCKNCMWKLTAKDLTGEWPGQIAIMKVIS